MVLCIVSRLINTLERKRYLKTSPAFLRPTPPRLKPSMSRDLAQTWTALQFTVSLIDSGVGHQVSCRAIRKTNSCCMIQWRRWTVGPMTSVQWRGMKTHLRHALQEVGNSYLGTGLIIQKVDPLLCWELGRGFLGGLRPPRPAGGRPPAPEAPGPGGLGGRSPPGRPAPQNYVTSLCRWPAATPRTCED